MIIIMIYIMNIKFIGMKLHEIFGIVIFIIFIIHKLLNIKMIQFYFKNSFNKKLKKDIKYYLYQTLYYFYL